MAWHQSHMFSSTAQILEVYLEPSPVPSENGSSEMRWTPITSTTGESKMLGSNKQIPTSYPYPQSLTTTPTTSMTEASPAASPASSHTQYSSANTSPKKAMSSEIRRRRLPEGVEPRAKNLALTKSNGATNPLPLPPAVHDLALTAASSNYSRSPPMDSPAIHPPPPPPKAAARSVPRKPIARKPTQEEREIQNNISTISRNDSSYMVDSNPYATQPAQSQIQSNVTSPPPRTTSLNKHMINKKSIPIHKKTLSTASSNKDLPPDPPIDRSLLPKKNSFSSTASTIPLKEDGTKKSNPSTEIRGLPAGPKGLPSGPKLSSNATVPRRPIPAKEENVVKPAEPVVKGLSRGGPTLGSLSSGPKPKPVHQTSASLSTLTSATVSGPIPLPDFQLHRRAESDVNKSSLRSHSRGRSQSKNSTSAPEEMITIAMEAPRPTETHRSTQSQGSIRSDTSMISRSTTPQSQRSVSTAPTSISSLPGVPEVRSPLIAPEIKPSHFTCYTQHRPLVASSNHLAPILCMTCKADSEKMWGCGWCHLRICTGCKDALVEVKNDLRKMLDESAAGTLIIGKERIPNPPFMSNNGPRSYGSDTSSIHSNGSSGSRQMYPRGAGSRPVFAPPQPHYMRQERSMDSLHSQGSGGGRRNPYGPPMHRNGPPPQQQQMRSQPLDYIGMPNMNNQPRQLMPPRNNKPSTAPQSPSMMTPTFGPVSLGLPSKFQGGHNQYSHQQYNDIPSNPYHNYNPRRAGPSQPKFDDDGYMPPMLDLSLEAGAGPMAAGLRGLNLGGAPRPINPFTMGGGPYPQSTRAK